MFLNKDEYKKLISEHFQQANELESYEIKVPVYVTNTETQEESIETYTANAQKMLASGMPVFVFYDSFHDGSSRYVVKKKSDILEKPVFVDSLSQNDYILSLNKKINEKQTLDQLSEMNERDSEMKRNYGFIQRDYAIRDTLINKRTALDIMDYFKGLPLIEFDHSDYTAEITVELPNGDFFKSGKLELILDDELSNYAYDPVIDLEDRTTDLEDDLYEIEDVQAFTLNKDVVSLFFQSTPLKHKKALIESFTEAVFMDDDLYEKLLTNPENETVLEPVYPMMDTFNQQMKLSKNAMNNDIAVKKIRKNTNKNI
jgi:hypothetical protein